MDKKLNILFKILGIFFVILALIAYFNAIRFEGTAGFLWFSYTALLLIGIGILYKKPQLIASQLNIILIPYIVWNIDFFSILIFSQSIFGITEYFFAPGRPLTSQIITLQHIFIVPISLIFLYYNKLESKNFWKISAIQVTFFYILGILIGGAQNNVNCIFENCLPFSIPSNIYPIAWFAAYAFMIFSTTYFLTKMKLFTKTKHL